MAKGKKRLNVSKLKGIRLYNFLLKRLGEQNAKLPKQQQLGIARRRQIVSTQLYPKFKQYDKIPLRLVNSDLKALVKALPPAEICNPLYLSEAYLAFVEYYEIDNHIKTVLPDCLDVRVNAGRLGKTKIFNTRNYSYYGDGVRKIIETVRQELAENKSGMAYFNGVVKTKPNRKNNGNPDNYFVEYVLYINDEPEADDTPTDYDLPNKEQKKVEKVKDYLSEKFKQLEKEKRKRKRARKKAEPKKPSETKKQTAEKVRTAVNALKSLLKLGVITKQEFEQQKETLMKFKKRS
jgi:hypothetical protein